MDSESTSKPKRKLRPRAPQIYVSVTAKHIDDAVPKDSSHCMVADAVRDAFPSATSIAVDMQTIRFTDPKKGLRYAYLTPRDVAVGIVEWDEGILPTPYGFWLRKGSVHTAGRKKKATKLSPRLGRAALVKDGSDSNGPEVDRRVGGKEPPQFSKRREFGMRAFAAARENRRRSNDESKWGSSSK